MQGGRGVSVQEGENHAVHLRVHLEDAARFLQALQANQVDLRVAASYLQLQYPHSMAHLDQLRADKSRENDVKTAQEILNQVREAVENIGKQMQAMAQREAKAKAQAQARSQSSDPKTQIALQKAKVDSQIKLEQAELDRRLKIADTEQKLALRDAETAQKIRKNKLA